ncbi:helix-turn-helix domain-containing protein [Streptacidiphilus jiangxiensis]|uniref:Helix-turn-helix domain-containing protein n=1 Tax=Streptacidiphilus jiangxiensis TaxID=235985 RepID=A0A1H7H2P4_STRJI|nr:helix-turn-helix transcriptional regulator [Streptacidiphilus jiangxiensis]SEK44569.1 Helix-turn-helix domain-containing protein [Streptacidiphilus jiangxiensis]
MTQTDGQRGQDPKHVGAVIRQARRLKGLTQTEFAARLGYHQTKISRLERLGTQDIQVLRMVADQLDIPLRALGLSNIGNTDIETENMHRRSFLAASASAVAGPTFGRRTRSNAGDLVLALMPGRPTAPSHMPVIDELEQRTLDARGLFGSCRYRELNASLPVLITDLRSARAEQDDPRVSRLLATAYQVAASTLLKRGDLGNAWLAVGRAVAESEQSGDPAALAASVRIQGHALIRGGHAPAAVTSIRHSAGQLSGSYDHRSQTLLAALGLLLLRGATAASRAHDRGSVKEFLTEATEIARYVQVDRPDSWANFSSTNLALHTVSTHVALGDAGAALDAATPLMRRRIQSPERRAALWLDIARANSQLGRLDEAHRALRIAQQAAPEDVGRPAVLELIADLTTRDRSGKVPGLRRMCDELGVLV